MIKKLRKPTAKAIEKHLGITPAELVCPSKILAYTKARAIYYRLRQLQDPDISMFALGNELNRKCTTVVHALRPINIRLILKDIIPEYGRMLRQLRLDDAEFRELKRRRNETTDRASRPIDTATNRVFGMPKKRATRYVFNEESKSAKTLHGFNFSLEEDQAISRVCLSCAEFMKSYGKGKKIEMIAKEYYL